MESGDQPGFDLFFTSGITRGLPAIVPVALAVQHTRPDVRGRTPWFGRFLDYLKAHGRLQDLWVMPFEHYPYDRCDTPWEKLYQEPALISHLMQVWRDDGLPPDVPLLDTETKAHGGEASVEIFGALWLADSFAGILAAGGQSTHYYHDLSYSPPHSACPKSWGTYHLFMVDDHYQILRPTSQFFAAQIIAQEWASQKMPSIFSSALPVM